MGLFFFFSRCCAPSHVAYYHKLGFRIFSSDCASLLRRCGSGKALSDGKRVHQTMVENGSEQNPYLANLLVQMYGLCGALEDAHAVFSLMSQHDQFSWMFIISAYARHGQGETALQLLDRMQLQDVVPDKFILASLLSACTGMADIAQGMHLHTYIMKNGFAGDIVVGTSLVHMYAKCGSLEDAQQVFNNMPERNRLSWTAMITAYAQHGRSDEAFRVFDQMQQYGTLPDQVTLTSLLPAFSSAVAMVQGKRMHSCIVGSGLKGNVAVGNSLINMYGKLNSVEDARHTFNRLPKKDTVSWTAMIGIYTQCGQSEVALQLFEQMHLEGIAANRVTYVNILSTCATPILQERGRWLHACIVGMELESDVVVGNALINMYAKGGRLKDAHAWFDKMQVRDAVSWTAVITAYAQHGLGRLGLEHFNKMHLSGIEPNNVTFVSILSACASQSALVGGKKMHHYIIDSGFESDTVVGTALIHMYGKCGSLEEARGLFNKMLERNVCAWAAMIAAYAHNGHGEEALQLFSTMKEEHLRPDGVTFLNILSACNHAGLVVEGHYFFVSMTQDYSIKPLVDHYHCMIDLHGRVGRLEEAKNMIHDMPYEPTVVTWMTLLSACRTYMDVEQGEHAANCIFRLDPENAKSYVMLSNIYAAAGRADDARSTINRMKEKCPSGQVQKINQRV